MAHHVGRIVRRAHLNMVANLPTESRMNPTSNHPQGAEFAPLPEALLGLKTRKAARLFQAKIAVPQDGYANKALLLALRAQPSV